MCTFVKETGFDYFEKEIRSVESDIDDALEKLRLFGTELVIGVVQQLELLLFAVEVVQNGERGVLLGPG